MSDARIISFEVFRQAQANKDIARDAAAEHTATIKPRFSAKAHDKFVGFSMAEQQQVLSLHQEFSGASRDYKFSHKEGAAFIYAAHTNELLDDEVYFESADIAELTAKLAPYLERKQEAQYAENRATAEKNAKLNHVSARRASFKLV
jgi:hypothetical protein